MHIELREWEMYAILRQLVVEQFVVIKIHIPVVGALNPCTHLQIDTRRSKFVDKHRRRVVGRSYKLAAFIVILQSSPQEVADFSPEESLQLEHR